jgi:3-hydroxybutyryl-CoA dehydrogenase
VLKHLEDSHEPSPLLREKVEKGELGFKAGGVGFQNWTPDEQKALRANLLDYLTKAIRTMKEEEAK